MILSTGNKPTFGRIDTLQRSQHLIQGFATAASDGRFVQTSIISGLELLEVLSIRWIRSFRLLKNMTEFGLGVLLHDRAGKYGALVGAHVMQLAPPTADILIEVGARINVCVVGIEVVQDLRCCVNTLRRVTEGRRLRVWGTWFVRLV